MKFTAQQLRDMLTDASAFSMLLLKQIDIDTAVHQGNTAKGQDLQFKVISDHLRFVPRDLTDMERHTLFELASRATGMHIARQSADFRKKYGIEITGLPEEVL